MIKYLLDTNICVFLLRGKYHVDEVINKHGLANCAISEITLAELKYGAELGRQKGIGYQYGCRGPLQKKSCRCRRFSEILSEVLRGFVIFAVRMYTLKRLCL